MSHAAKMLRTLTGACRRWLWRLVRRSGLSNATATINFRKLTIGAQWRRKPRALWIEVPAVTLYWSPGIQCPNCHGQGAFAIEAGGGCWTDECETCAGTGAVGRKGGIAMP